MQDLNASWAAIVRCSKGNTLKLERRDYFFLEKEGESESDERIKEWRRSNRTRG